MRRARARNPSDARNDVATTRRRGSSYGKELARGARAGRADFDVAHERPALAAVDHARGEEAELVGLAAKAEVLVLGAGGGRARTLRLLAAAADVFELDDILH